MSPSASRSGVAAPCFGDLPATLQGAQAGADLTATATGAAFLHHRPGDTFGEVTTLRELGPAAGKRTADAGRLQHAPGLLPNTTPSGAGHPLPGADHTVPGAGLATVSGAEHTVPGAGPVDHLPSHSAVDPSSHGARSGTTDHLPHPHATGTTDHLPSQVSTLRIETTFEVTTHLRPSPAVSLSSTTHLPGTTDHPSSQVSTLHIETTFEVTTHLRPSAAVSLSSTAHLPGTTDHLPHPHLPRTTTNLPSLAHPSPSEVTLSALSARPGAPLAPSAPSDARTQGAPRGSATQATEDAAARSPVADGGIAADNGLGEDAGGQAAPGRREAGKGSAPQCVTRGRSTEDAEMRRATHVLERGGASGVPGRSGAGAKGLLPPHNSPLYKSRLLCSRTTHMLRLSLPRTNDHRRSCSVAAASRALVITGDLASVLPRPGALTNFNHPAPAQKAESLTAAVSAQQAAPASTIAPLSAEPAPSSPAHRLRPTAALRTGAAA